MTALTMPQVKLEMDLTGTGPGTAPTYTDYSTYLRLSDGVTFSRGRQDERSTVTAGAASFTLNNDAGTFTRKPLRAPVRLSARFDDTASYTVMWTGYVTGWERGWTNGVRASMRVTAADAVMLLEKTTLPSLVRGEILADAPVAYWPLDDAAGSTVATDRTGASGVPSLAVTQIGTGGTLDFGTAIPADPDNSTAVTFTPVDANNGPCLFSTLSTSIGMTTSATGTLEAWLWLPSLASANSYAVSALGSVNPNDSQYVFLGVDSSNKWYTGMNGNGLSSTATATAATWTHVVTTWSGGNHTLYVNGAEATTASFYTSRDAFVGAMRVGTHVGTSANYAWSGAVAHVALYSTALSSTRIAAHYAALTGGVRSDERFDTIGAISDVTVSTPSNGSATMGVQSIAGTSVWSALTDVAFAEQGAAYIAADGTPTLAVRSARYGATPAITFNGKDVDVGTRFVIDDSYLANDVTVSRPGGATARRRNTASQAAYGTKSDTYEAYYDTDAQVEYLAEWLANSRGVTGERVGSLTIDATVKASTVDIDDLLALDVSDLVRYVETVTGEDEYDDLYDDVYPGFDVDLVVEGLSDRFDLRGWSRTLNVSPNFLSSVWLLDDATYSQLGTTTVLGF